MQRSAKEPPNQDSYMTRILKKLSYHPQNVQHTKEPPTKTQERTDNGFTVSAMPPTRLINDALPLTRKCQS